MAHFTRPASNSIRRKTEWDCRRFVKDVKDKRHKLNVRLRRARQRLAKEKQYADRIANSGFSDEYKHFCRNREAEIRDECYELQREIDKTRTYF